MKTKYPILLVHGLTITFVHPFGRIDRILRIQGYTVDVSGIDGFGSVENNAAQLKKEIQTILEREHVEKVNLIAHSKGGLDARYMIEHGEMAEHVASLTTLCTPHRGSPIASFILRFPQALLRLIAFWIDLVYRIAGDRQPDSLKVCRQLQRVTAMEQETLCTDQRVFCQSFSAAIRPETKHTDFVMGIPMWFSRLIEKNSLTDGLVPRDSAIYGTYRGDCIDGSVSHTEIIDYLVQDKHRDRIFAFYSALCEELAGMGY